MSRRFCPSTDAGSRYGLHNEAARPLGHHRRWQILGGSGSGKSTLAREMADILRLPAVHLDRHYWKSDWVETARDAWIVKVTELVQGEAWVMDGNYGGSLHVRLPRTDAVVLLDLPPWSCLWGVYKRRLFPGPSGRPDLAEGCPEQFPDLEFLRWIVSYRWSGRRRVLAKLADWPDMPFIHLRSRRAVRAFIARLKDSSGESAPKS